MVKNLSANAGAMSPITGPGGFNMPQNNKVCKLQLRKTVHLEVHLLCNRRSHCNEKSMLQLDKSPHTAMRTQDSPK